MGMKATIIMFLLVLIVLLLANTVISKRLDFAYSPNSSSIIVHFDSPENPYLFDHIEMDLKLIVLLFGIGFIGIASVARRRIGDKNNEKDISP